MMRPVAAFLLLAALASNPALAQRPVLTVGGTNPTHASLPAAVAAAAPGSVIIVRPGSHTGFTTNKALRLVLDFTSQTGTISPAAAAPYTIEVNGIGSGQEFAIVGRGARLFAGSIGAVRIANCSGRVAIDGVTATLGNTKDALCIQNAAGVMVQNSTLAGRVALQVQDAVVTASAVSFASAVGTAVVGLRGTFEFALGSFTGTLTPAVRVTDSTARLAGNGSTTMRVNGSPAVPVAAFEAVQSAIEWDASQFVLVPQNGAPGFLQAGGTLAVRQVPALTGTGAPPGGTLTVTLSRSSAAPGLIVLGNLALRHSAFGLDGIFLDDLAPLLLIAIGPANAAGLVRQATWPNAPWLLGEVFGCQGVVLVGSTLVTSGPVVWAAM